MDLYGLIWQTQRPFFRPPPLRVQVVATVERPIAVDWDFQYSPPRPAIKYNKEAVISDGRSVHRITIFEQFAEHFKEGSSYVLRGYALRGQAPPYILSITKQTRIFRCSRVIVGERLVQEAKALLQPPSLLTPLSECAGKSGFVTVEGDVVEATSVTRMESGQRVVPLRSILLQKGTARMRVWLWREAAVVDLQLGSQIRLSHLKRKESSYGPQLHTTRYTRFEEVQTETVAEVIGVMESTTSGLVELLMDSNEVFRADAVTWQPFEEQLQNGPVRVRFQATRNFITSLDAIV